MKSAPIIPKYAADQIDHGDMREWRHSGGGVVRFDAIHDGQQHHVSFRVDVVTDDIRRQARSALLAGLLSQHLANT